MATRLAGRALFCLLALLAGWAWAGTDREDVRFLEGLRHRRLFRLAESYCRERLSNEALDGVRRADLTLELIRCYAAQAVHAPPDARQASWDQARQTAAEFLRQHPSDPHVLLVRVQDALTLLARGELHRQESEVLADAADAAAAALESLREAVRLLEQLDEELAREIPLRHRLSSTSDQLSADQLISLQHNVQFQLARAYRNRALCYPTESEDRTAALTGAVDQLKKPLTQITENDPLIWPIRLDLAICLRLLGQMAEAEGTLQAIEQSDADAELRLRARAERARIHLDRRQPEQALAVLQAGRQLAGQTAADLDYAYLQTTLALWQAAVAADDAQAADLWRKRAVEVVQLVEQAYGPYWGRRGDLLLVRTVGRSQAQGDIDILGRAADDLYRQGQWDEAVKTYEQAGAAAGAAGDTDQAFALRYKAALVDHQRQQHDRAGQRLRRLALDLPDYQKAPDVHLLAAWNTAQLARSQPEFLELYGEILQEHIRRWPASNTADAARLWLGRLRESQRQWQAAAEAFQAVSGQYPEYESALRDAARCWTTALQLPKADGQSDVVAARAAAAAFQKKTPLGDDPPSRPWTPADRFCAEQAARLLVEFTPDGYAEAERILQGALDGEPPPDASWRTSAESLRIVALAGQPTRRSLAEERLLSVGLSSPPQLLQILKGVAPILEAADPEVRQSLASLQVAVAERLWQQRDQLADDQRTMLHRVRAEALLLAGRDGQARTAYADLADQNPNDGEIQQAYAQLLLDGPSREDWQQALDAWRRIAARSRPQTELWYDARYAIASALVKLNQRDEAARRIRYLQALPPGLAGTPWEAKFQQLLDQCDRSE